MVIRKKHLNFFLYKTKDEEDRYNDLYMVYQGKWIFIRFNPDAFRDDKDKRRNPDLKKRFPILLKEIEKQIERIKQCKNLEMMEVTKLFFDAEN